MVKLSKLTVCKCGAGLRVLQVQVAHLGTSLLAGVLRRLIVRGRKEVGEAFHLG